MIMELTENHIKLIQDYIAFVKVTGMYPGRADLYRKGWSRDQLRYYFSNLTILRQKAREWSADNYPEAFSHVIDSNIFTEKNLEALKQSIKKHKRFVITSCVVGCPAHPMFL